MRSRSLLCAVFFTTFLPVYLQTAFSGTVLPNGRQITPAGKWIETAPYPFTLALRRDGKQLVVPSIGFPFALNVVDDPISGNAVVRQIPVGVDNDPAVEVYTGATYSPDGRLFYNATGDSGAVDVFRTSDWKKMRRIPLDGKSGSRVFTHSFAAALCLSSDGKRLYVVDQANWRIALIEMSSGMVVGSVPTGVNSIAICLSPDGKRLYVANSGLFEYRPVPNLNANDVVGSGLRFPPFPYPSVQARTGVDIGGRWVAGLGDENSVRGSSVWTYDVSDLRQPKQWAQLRVGRAIGQRGGVVGGAAPSAIVADAKHVYVALAHEDGVAVLTADGHSSEAEIALSPLSGLVFPTRKEIRCEG